MNRLPTRRALVVAGAGVLLVLAGITAQAGWLFVLAAGALGLVAGSMAVHHRLGSIQVEHTLPRTVRVGDQVAGGLILKNGSASSAPMFVVEDQLDAFDPIVVGSERIAGNASVRAEIVRTARRRGIYTEGKVTLTSGSPFGLVRSRRRKVVPLDLTVVPRWVTLGSFPLLDPSSDARENPEEIPMVGVGQEYMGIREYRPGDPLRSVHWRSTARASKLIVREFEREVSSRIGVVLAGGDRGQGPASAFETMVSAAASIGMYALASGHSLALAAPSDVGSQLVVGPSSHEMLSWLAAAQPRDSSLVPLVDEVLATLGDRATVVIVASDRGTTGASIADAMGSVDRQGGRAILVVAESATWDPSLGPSTDRVAGADAARVLRADRELEACLAG